MLCPAPFAPQSLGKDTLVPFDLFGESWVLFRDEKGAAACIKDTCAHRACPLSLGKVTDGQVGCQCFAQATFLYEQAPVGIHTFSPWQGRGGSLHWKCPDEASRSRFLFRLGPGFDSECLRL